MHIPRDRRTTLTAILGAVLVFVPGCNVLLEELRPETLAAGYVVRRVSGRQGLFRGDVTFPLTRLQVEKHLAERWDAYARFDFVNGQVEITEGVIGRDARGDMQWLCAGVLYTPFCRYVFFELGGEVFHSDFAVHTEAGPFRLRLNDSAYGWALTAGAGVRVPLGKHVDFVLGGGYSAGDNDSRAVNLDFDGYYWSAGLRFKLDRDDRNRLVGEQ